MSIICHIDEQFLASLSLNPTTEEREKDLEVDRFGSLDKKFRGQML